VITRVIISDRMRSMQCAVQAVDNMASGVEKRYVRDGTSPTTNSMELCLFLETPVAKLLKNLSKFHGTRGFITVFVRTLHIFLP
jgi:hypothetical protein